MKKSVKTGCIVSAFILFWIVVWLYMCRDTSSSGVSYGKELESAYGFTTVEIHKDISLGCIKCDEYILEDNQTTLLYRAYFTGDGEFLEMIPYETWSTMGGVIHKRAVGN